MYSPVSRFHWMWLLMISIQHVLLFLCSKNPQLQDWSFMMLQSHLLVKFLILVLIFCTHQLKVEPILSKESSGRTFELKKKLYWGDYYKQTFYNYLTNPVLVAPGPNSVKKRGGDSGPLYDILGTWEVCWLFTMSQIKDKRGILLA